MFGAIIVRLPDLQNFRTKTPAEHPAHFGANVSTTGKVNFDNRPNAHFFFAFGHEAAFGNICQLARQFAATIVIDHDIDVAFPTLGTRTEVFGFICGHTQRKYPFERRR